MVAGTFPQLPSANQTTENGPSRIGSVGLFFKALRKVARRLSSRGCASMSCGRGRCARPYLPGSVEALVRAEGLEPPQLSSLEPKSSASTNSATPAARIKTGWHAAGGGLITRAPRSQQKNPDDGRLDLAVAAGHIQRKMVRIHHGRAHFPSRSPRTGRRIGRRRMIAGPAPRSIAAESRPSLALQRPGRPAWRCDRAGRIARSGRSRASAARCASSAATRSNLRLGNDTARLRWR